MFGSFFVPQNVVHASFLSGLFNSDASANTNTTTNNTDMNSQNMGLLQANVSSVAVIQEKKDKNYKDKKIDETKDVNISENALLPATGPDGVSDGLDEGISPDQISIYVVREGDSIAKIAEMFGVSANTILWSNDMKKGDKLVKDDVLIIPPVSGLIHTVAKGQTLQSIAKLYKVDVADIVDANDIGLDEKLVTGDELIIPGAEIADSSVVKPVSKPVVAKSVKKYPTQNLVGYFTNPVPEYRKKTQGLHGNNGVDLAAPTGTSIVAAASGTVIFARNGRNGGYGNMVVISHPNGTETLYGHASKILTHIGAQVSQGDVIALVGSTGHSTGPHLHFEVHGARNNAADLPVFR